MRKCRVHFKKNIPLRILFNIGHCKLLWLVLCTRFPIEWCARVIGILDILQLIYHSIKPEEFETRNQRASEPDFGHMTRAPPGTLLPSRSRTTGTSGFLTLLRCSGGCTRDIPLYITNTKCKKEKASCMTLSMPITHSSRKLDAISFNMIVWEQNVDRRYRQS